MATSIEKQVEDLLQQGLSKKTIWERLKKETDPYKLHFFLNNSSLPANRKKFQILNLLLIVILAFFTFKKLLVAFSFGTLDLFLLLSLVVPIINIYILREILRFRRLGYKFLFVLSLLALVHPENHHLQELALLAIQIVLAGFLYLRLFPKKDALPKPE